VSAFLAHRPVGALVVAVALTAACPVLALATAEARDTDQTSEQSESKTQGKSEGKSEVKAEGKADTKSGDKGKENSGDKQDNDKSEKKSEEKEEGTSGAKSEDNSEDIWQRKMLFGDLGGLRPALDKYGIKLGLAETSEVLGNPTGGRHQGLIYEGLTDLSLNIDFRPTLHLRGNVFARAYQIHGRGLTTTIGNLNEISGIEAAATTRLVELWYEQHFSDWLIIRIGQQTIGPEFLSPEAARLFVNGAFGWPTLPGLDLPTGGPGFPLGTPAAHVRIDPTEGLTLSSALFNGDPTGAGVGGSQLADPSGTAFRIGDGALFITELRYNPESSDQNGTYYFGGWFHSKHFSDLRFDISGIPLASPASSGQPRRHEGDFSLYSMIDQPFLTDPEAHTGFVGFARIMGAPSDRNLVDLYLDAGLVYKGPFGRADDQIGLSVAHAGVGRAAIGFDADVARFTGTPYPIRSGETNLELTYRFQLAPWWQLQPDFQYVFNPGGGLPNPNAPTRRLSDAAVFGLRTAITF
jgi:porin